MCSSADSTLTARWFSSGFSGSPGSPRGTRRKRRRPRRAALRTARAAPARSRAAGTPAPSPRASSTRARRGRGRSRPRSAPPRARAEALVHVEVGLAVAGAVDRQAVAEIPGRLVEARDSQRDVLERAGLARPLGREQRQLPAARVRADERERVGAVDDVHADALRDEVRDRVALGHPEGDVVERLGRHAGQDNDAATSCGRLRAEAAACSSSSGPRFPSAWPRCRAAPSCGPRSLRARSGARRGGPTRCPASTSGRASFASPFRARSLLTVRAAISFARFVERPCFFSLSLMCSYWRSRFVAPCLLWHCRPPRSVRERPAREVDSKRYSSGWFWTLCSVAYSSVSLLITSMPSP